LKIKYFSTNCVNLKKILPSIILLGILIFLLSCRADYKPVDTSVLDQDFPNVIMTDFKTEYYKGENRTWELFANQALYFDKSNTIKLSNLTLNFYDKKNKKSSIIVSQYGVVYNESKNIELLSNVVMRSSNNTVIRGIFFLWDNALEIITSPFRVTVIHSNGDRTSGIGFMADKNFETITWNKNVVGSIDDKNIKDSDSN